MVQLSNSIKTAVANHSGAMESRDHFKNGASSKSHKSRESFLHIIALMMYVFPFLLVSCGKNEMDENSVIHKYRVQNVLYAKGSKLKNLSSVESVKSKKGGIIITQYEYDERGRISKVSQPMYENGTFVGLFSYSNYVYNSEGLLDKIIYYHSNTYAGFLNLKTDTYSYDKNGNKLKALIEYPVINQTDSILYFFDKNRLVREDYYEWQTSYDINNVAYKGLQQYVEYEYDNHGNMVKETNYSGRNDIPLSFSIHSYQNRLNVKTEVFNCYRNNEKIREIRRYYDKNDNLIYLESEELAWYSSAMSYVTKYEYY